MYATGSLDAMKKRLSKLHMNFHVWVLLLLVAAIAGSSAYVEMNVRLREVHPFIMWAPVFSVALAIASIVFLHLRQRLIAFMIGLVAGLLLLPAAVIVSLLFVVGGPPT